MHFACAASKVEREPAANARGAELEPASGTPALRSGTSHVRARGRSPDSHTHSGAHMRCGSQPPRRGTGGGLWSRAEAAREAGLRSRAEAAREGFAERSRGCLSPVAAMPPTGDPPQSHRRWGQGSRSCPPCSHAHSGTHSHTQNERLAARSPLPNTPCCPRPARMRAHTR